MSSFSTQAVSSSNVPLPLEESATSAAGLAQRLNKMEDRIAVIDALYRFAAGQDMKDTALFASAFAEEAELDFVQPAARLGVTLAPFKGRDAIVSSIMAAVGQLDTSHTVTNPRVEISGDRAGLHALVEAQHVPKDDHERHLLLKNFYEAELKRNGDLWRITSLRITNIWMDGDGSVLFPGR